MQAPTGENLGMVRTVMPFWERVWKSLTLRFIAGTILVTVVILLIIFCVLFDRYRHSEQDWKNEKHHHQLVRQINNVRNVTWKAVYNPYAVTVPGKYKNETLANSQNALAYCRNDKSLDDTREHVANLQKMKTDTLPKTFDARLKWPLCPSLHTVPNQGECGSCWAVSAASVISDRICIHSNFTKIVDISIEDLLTCCYHTDGCLGSTVTIMPFLFWRDSGLVSGGSYGSFEGCRPYSISAKCGTICGMAYFTADTPKCKRECRDGFHKQYKDDKNYASTAYWLSWIIGDEDVTFSESIFDESEAESIIQKEIMKNGPVVVCLLLYEDIQHYISGVYQYVAGDTLYGHCVRAIGWGETETGIPYWTIVNSWGSDWGEKGFIRLHRKYTKELRVVAGLPKIE